MSSPATLLLLLAVYSGHVAGRKQYLNSTGDIVLGALFPVHRKGTDGRNECGKIQMEDGLQTLEAMLFTVKQINADPTLLPGIELGMLALDSCDSPAHGLQQSLVFVKGFIAHINEHHEVNEFRCSDGAAPKYLDGGFDNVVAVIGGQSSSVTIQVANMLRLFQVPQVSYMSTSPSLSNKERFPYFFRTVPSDVNQAHAMLEILRHFNWTYVSVVYSDNEYGNHGYEKLNELASNYSICFATPQRIDKDHFTDKDYERVLNNIVKKSNVRVVLVFAEKSTTLRLLEASRRHGSGNRFVWIGSDAWSTTSHREKTPRSADSEKSPHILEDMRVLEGALAIQPLARTLGGFDDYFKALTLDHEEVNPWFREYWREYFRCGRRTNETAHGSSNVSEVDEDEDCYNPALSISTTKGYRQQRYLHFVRDAVYSVAHALHDMQTDRCGAAGGMCEGMKHIDGTSLKEYLSNVTFKDEGGQLFRFLDGRDGPPRYSILNFQQETENSYHWHIVGNYTLSEDGTPILKIDHQAIRYRHASLDLPDQKYFPNSSCGQPCRVSEIKVREGDDTCCWKCRACGDYQKLEDEFNCKDCLPGYLPTRDHGECIPIPEEFIDFRDTGAIVAMAVASLGVLLTVFVGLIFWTYSETPVIKASGRELSYLLLLGTLASFCVTFVIVARPTAFTCGATRFFLGFCYTLCYAAIVTKTNRIARIFSRKPNLPHKTKYTSPQSQLVITALLTSVEVVILVSWLMYSPPSVTHTYPTRDSNLRICVGLDDHSYMVGLLYPFVLIGLCTAYAIKTRKCPGGFNETRHIAFTNYTAVIIWLAFVPLYLTSTSNAVRIVTLAMSLSLSGLVQLGCLFFPKLYIVLLKPEKNTKEVVMSQHRSSSYLATSTNLTPVGAINGGHYGNGDSVKSADVTQQSSPMPFIWRTRASLRDFRSIPLKTLTTSDLPRDLTSVPPEVTVSLSQLRTT